MNLTREDVELEFLEDLFEDDCKCESRSHLEQCSKDVTHRFVSNHRNISVCADTARYVKYANSNGAICRTCGHFTSECWTITPI